jgi:Circadian oscillating protein COP23
MSFRQFSLHTGLLTVAGLAMTVSLASTPASAQSIPVAGDVIIPTDESTIPGGTSPGSTIPTTGNVPLSGVRFSCANESGRYTVMYQPESQVGNRYAWAVPQQMGGGWSPQARCNEISSRLERYRADGLVEMQTATENGYNTVCVTTDANPGCRIVFTVPRGQDAVSTRDQVFQNLATADSGQRTTGVFTLRNQTGANVVSDLGKAFNVNLGGMFGNKAALPATPPAASNGIYLKPFLDKADGGTGERLTQKVAAPAVVAPVIVPPVVVPPKVTTPPAKAPVKVPAKKVFKPLFRKS